MISGPIKSVLKTHSTSCRWQVLVSGLSFSGGGACYHLYRPFFVSTSPKTTASTSTISAAKMTAMTTTTTDTAKPKFPWCVVAECCDDVDSSLTPETLLSSATTKIVSLHPVSGKISDNTDVKEGISPIHVFDNEVDVDGEKSEGGRQQRFDMTQIADWMEVIEHDENRRNDNGGAGAYDSFRCDLILTAASNDNNQIASRRWIWGEEYHLERLQASYMSLLCDESSNCKDSKSEYLDDRDRSGLQSMIDVATMESKLIVHRLLQAAEKSPQLMNTSTLMKQIQNDDRRRDVIQLVRVTLLWSPPKDDTSTKIVLRGHACSSGRPMMIHSSPEPISVSVAVHKAHHNHHPSDGVGKQQSSRASGTTSSTDTIKHLSSSESMDIDVTLPTRLDNPQSKVASWCRERKKMEDPNTYKPEGASEVIMVRPRTTGSDGRGSRMELLEGLSSNVFFVYKDGSLRTAADGILNGYVRHLVLESAKNLDIRLDPRPIYLDEVNEWNEAFITSSSRLIFPISKILIPNDDDENGKDDDGGTSSTTFSEYWTDKVLIQNANRWTNDSLSPAPPVWWRILNDILKAAGY